MTDGAEPSNAAAVTAHRVRTPRAAAVAGIIFAVLAIVLMAMLQTALPSDPPSDPRWLSNHEEQVAVATAIVPFAAIAFLWFVGVLRDAGLSTATVQRRTLDHDQVTALFWINTLLGFVLAGAMLAGAPLVASFYREPGVAAVTMALGAAFIPGGLAAQHHALLRRRMRFGAIAAIEAHDQGIVDSEQLSVLLAVVAATAVVPTLIAQRGIIARAPWPRDSDD